MCGRRRNVEDMMAHPKFGEQQTVASSNTTRSGKDSSNSRKADQTAPQKVMVEHSVSVRVENHPEESDLKMPPSSRATASNKNDSKKSKRTLVKCETAAGDQKNPKSQKRIVNLQTPPTISPADLVDQTQLNSCKDSEKVITRKPEEMKGVYNDPALESSQASDGAGNVNPTPTNIKCEKKQMPSTCRASSVASCQKTSVLPAETTKMSTRDISQKDRLKGWFSKFVKRKKPEAIVHKAKEAPMHSESCEETYDTQPSTIHSPLK